MTTIDARLPELAIATCTFPRRLVDEIRTDPRWRAEMPELFTPGFVSIDRYLRTT